MSLKNIVFFYFLIFSFSSLSSQEIVTQTFKDTRIINSQSIETLKNGQLDVRISHRFGDIGGDQGGWPTFYGLENAEDVLIGLEYGLSDRVMVGVNRTKGSGPLKQNLNGLFKVKFINQEIGGNQPLSIGLVGMTTYSTMQKSNSEGVLNFFAVPAHRFSYHIEAMVARRFSKRFSFQISGSLTHRNIVAANDENSIATIGAGMRLQLSKSLGIVLDGKLPFSKLRTAENGYYQPLGLGLEWETGGGHVFQFNVTNATGISETDYIPYTNTSWSKGEFRFGFTISRLFTL